MNEPDELPAISPCVSDNQAHRALAPDDASKKLKIARYSRQIVV